MGFGEKLASIMGISKRYDDDYYEDEGTYGGSSTYADDSYASSSSRSRGTSGSSGSRSTSSGGYSSYHSGYGSYDSDSSGSRYSSSSGGYSSSSYNRSSTASRSSTSSRSSASGATPYRSSGSYSSSSGYGSSSYSSRNFSSNASSMRNSKVVNLNANVQMEVVVVNPETLEDARDIALQIRERKPVVVNLEFADPRTAQRITDLLCGCSYALNGNIQRVSDKIFMVAPETIGFAGDLDIREKLQSEGALLFPWQEQY